VTGTSTPPSPDWGLGTMATVAGHLPPLLIGPDDDEQALAAPRASLLLGVDPEAGRSEQVSVIERGRPDGPGQPPT
jgi:hypothetical protein